MTDDEGQLDKARFSSFMFQKIVEDEDCAGAMINQGIEMGLMMVPGGEEMTPEQITAFKEDVLTKVGEAVQPLFDIIFTLFDKNGDGNVTYEGDFFLIWVNQLGLIIDTPCPHCRV